jgi:uncharacterized protein YecE (DUF72 family)
VEINNSFYRLPESTTFQAWADAVPDDFLFAVKASRFLTHMKRLRDPEEPVTRLFDRAASLGKHLGPVLYQLPGNFGIDIARLDAFLGVLPPKVHHVMEFRNRSWYTTETYSCLERHGASLCLHDKEGSQIDAPFVGPIVYVRFHGTSGRYHGGYATPALRRWASTLLAEWRKRKDVFVYFNNDPDAEAVRNATTLLTLLEELRQTPRASSAHGA